MTRTVTGMNTAPLGLGGVDRKAGATLSGRAAQRRPRNKRGFALQMCVLRSPGRLLASGKFVPPGGADFIGCRSGDELADYGARAATRQLRKIATLV